MDKKDHPKNWRNILWREWRYTDDEEYAERLFELVAYDTSISWQGTSLLILLGLVSGAGCGFLIALLSFFRTNWVTPTQEIDHLVTIISFIGIGSLIGVVTSLVIRLLLKKRFVWPEIFFKLSLGVIAGLIFWLLGASPLASLIWAIIFGTFIMSFPGKWHTSWLIIISPFITLFLVIGTFILPTVGLSSASILAGVTIGLFVWFVLSMIGTEGSKETEETDKYVDKVIGKWSETVIKYHGYSIPLIAQLLQHRYRHWHFWWNGQPEMKDLEIALRRMVATQSKTRKPWKKLLDNLDKNIFHAEQKEKFISNLQHDYWLTRFVANHALVSLGGEVADSLQRIAVNKNVSIKQDAVRILKNIAWETSTQLSIQAPNLVCPNCLTRYHAHNIDLPWQPDLTFYGCRTCQQSREFLECPQGIVAVLDAGWTGTYRHQNGLLRVNWSAQRRLFDFDRAEIIQAADEDVERFAMQVGNDTDPVRQPRYAHMQCLIAPDCRLSENSLRILQNFFGQVERQEIAQVASVIVEDTKFTLEENTADKQSLS